LTTLNLQVGASSDDAYQDSGGTANITSAAAAAGTGTSGVTPLRTYGVRFTSVTIPQGASIVSANLTVCKRNTTFNDVRGTWFGQADDNAATFSGGEDMTARTQTSATVVCSENISRTDGVFYAFPTGASWVSIVQEIVNRSGWASGNAMVFVFIGDNASSFTSTDVNSYDNSPSVAAKLDIDYSLPRLAQPMLLVNPPLPFDRLEV
jgi:hypothetical protein